MPMMRLRSLTTTALTVLVFLCDLGTTAAFAPFGKTTTASSTSSQKQLLYAIKPRLNPKTQLWEPAKDDDGKYPYDAIGSLLRHGPSPFITRTTNPSEYEQAVLKYMATQGVTRAEATGNVDAKLNNAMDWAYQKSAEKNGSPKVDYTKLSKKNAALVLVWAFGITPLTVSVIKQTIDQF
jgi:hypothetical protein